MKAFQLSPQQKRLLILHESTDVLCTNVCIEVGNCQSETAIKEAMNDLIRDHSILRTRFQKYEQLMFPLQVIEESGTCEVEFLKLPPTADDILLGKLKELNSEIRAESSGALVKVTVVKSGERSFMILRTLSVLLDRRSAILILKYLSDARHDGNVEVFQYSVFSEWCNENLNNAANNKGSRESEIDESSTLVLGSGKGISKRKSAISSVQLTLLSTRNQPLPPSAKRAWNLFCIWAILVNRFTTNIEFTLGYVDENRDYEPFENALGVYEKIVPIRVNIDPGLSMSECVDKISGCLDDAFESKDSWFSSVDSSIAHKTIIPVLFQYCDASNCKLIDTWSIAEPFGIKLEITDGNDGLLLDVKYDTGCYSEAQATSILSVYQKLIDLQQTQPGLPVNRLPLGVPLSLIQGAKVGDYNAGLLMHELYSRQAIETPDSIAIVTDGVSITYKYLDEITNHIAYSLQHNYSVRPGQVVAIWMKRSEDYIKTILGVLKAGGVYLPLELSVPSERVSLILADSNASLLVVDDEELAGFHEAVSLNTIISKPLTSNYSLPVLQQDDPAYVIYTSGSTGTPKGVLISHWSVANLMQGLIPSIGYDNGTTRHVALFASFTFDASVQQVFTTLLAGHQLIIVADDIKRNPGQLISYLRKHAIDSFDCTPTLFNLMLEDGNARLNLPLLKCILIGGEPWGRSLLQQYNASDLERVEVYNVYGPTECCVDNLMYRLPKGEIDRVPVGHPLANQFSWVLDESLDDLPFGLPGEIFIGGDNVGLGYLNQPELTHQKFINHPLLKFRIYSTGDLGRYCEDGGIEFINRKDRQVKVNGHRIELGEIEHVIKRFEGVSDAVVFLSSRNEGDLKMIACVITQLRISIEKLREFLAGQLPDYMTTLSFKILNKFPLTSSAKLDYKKIESLPDNTSEYVAPSTRLEQDISLIWAQVLGKDCVGVTDNFFDLGGQSLKAIRIVSRVNKALHIPLEFASIFQYPTIRELASMLDSNRRDYLAPISLVAVSDSYEVSSGQRRMLLNEGNNPYSTFFNTAEGFLLQGNLDVNVFKASLLKVVERHEILRTRFSFVKGEPVQQPDLPADKAVQFTIPGSSIPEDPALLGNLIASELAQPFDLQNGPLIRVSLYQTTTGKYCVVFAAHHIVSDEWSRRILLMDWLTLFDSLRNNKSPDLPVLNIQYKDYAAWQSRKLATNANSRSYWLEKLKDDAIPVTLTPDITRRTLGRKGKTVKMKLLDARSLINLKNVAGQASTTLFGVIVALVKITLYKYSGQTVVTIGTPVAGRVHSDLEHQVGYYSNTLPLRTTINRDATVGTIIQNVNQTIREAFNHEMYPLDQIIDDVGCQAEVAGQPLFNILVTVRNKEKELEELCNRMGLDISRFNYADQSAKFDVILDFQDTDNLELSVTFDSNLYFEETINRLGSHLRIICSECAAILDKPVRKVNLLSKDEINSLIHINRVVPSSEFQSVAQAFRSKAQLRPNSIALCDDQHTFTYRYLDEISDRMAIALRSRVDLRPDQAVGVLLERSVNVIVAILSIVKAGGAYLPFDSDFPMNRISQILGNASACALITDKPGLGDNIDKNVKVVYLHDLTVEIDNKEIPVDLSHPDSLAYIMYTSGSTGEPKGVMIEHRSILDLCLRDERISLEAGDKLMLTGSLAFDATTYEIWCTLLNGGTLYMLSLYDLLNAQRLLHRTNSLQIDVAWFTSSFFNALVDEEPELFSSFRFIVVGGEQVSSAHISRLKQRYSLLKIFNGFGPTEATTFSTIHETEDRRDDLVPIGTALRTSKVFVVNSDDQLAGVNINGELLIAGPGLARGYCNDPELTASRFVTIADSPFDGIRLYRTGDKARVNSRGLIEFKGRVDRQVKVGGYRIELQELESVVQLIEGVDKAIAKVIEESNQKLLAVYYSSVAGCSEGEVRSHLANQLPGHMIPSFVTRLDVFPLTRNGKISLADLPEIVIKKEGRQVPVGLLEADILSICENVLGCRVTDINANIFELGVNSLAASRVITRICSELNVNLKIGDLYKAPTISQISALIREARTKSFQFIEPVPGAGPYEVSRAQRAIWAECQLDNANHLYNQPLMYSVVGAVDVSILEKVLQKLFERFEILRTTFRIYNGQLKQSVLETFDIDNYFKYVDLSFDEDPEGRAHLLATTESQSRFDFTAAGMFKARLYSVGTNKSYLLIVLHHLVSDGWSVRIILNYITSWYDDLINGRSLILQPLKIQYKDYAKWYNEQLNEEALQKHRAFWRDRIGGRVEYLNIPTDYPRQVNQDFEVRGKDHVFPDKVAMALNKLGNQSNSTLFIVVASVTKILLHRLSGQVNITVGMPVSGRSHIQVENQVGTFTNTLMLNTVLDPADTFKIVLKKVKTSFLETLDHQDYPFDMLVNDLRSKNGALRFPFNVAVALQNIQLTEYNELSAGNLVVRPIRVFTKNSNMDLKFNFIDGYQSLRLVLEYNSLLFLPKTIESILCEFESLVSQVIEDPWMPLDKLKISMPVEQPLHARSFSTNFNIESDT